MPNYIGFSADQKLRMETAADWAKGCLDAALSVVFEDNDLFRGRLGKYITALGSGQKWGDISSLVMKTICSMKIVIDSDLYKVQLEPQANSPNTNAAMCSWKQDMTAQGRMLGTMQFDGKRMNVLEAQMGFVAKSGASKLSVYPLFFKLPFYAPETQCQVQSFLHELSHCAAGTVDYTDGGINPYGMTGVRACMRRGKSAQNAENISMFLATFA